MSNSEKTVQNVHKLVYLAREYPKKKITEIAGMMQIPVLEGKAAIWMAQDIGYITVDGKTEKFKIVAAPEEWDFGSTIGDIAGTVTYVMSKLAEEEADIEEGRLTTWMAAYRNEDTIIAIKRLLEWNILSTYKITDPKDKKSIYTFYTLAANKDKQWGKKQFKEI